MIDQIQIDQLSSVRRCSSVLGLRRQTYYSRKKGNRVEERDEEIIDLLHRTTQRFVAWGFWMIFYFLRLQGHEWNHKRVYRVWKEEGLNLRLPPQRKKIRREYEGLLSPDGINEGWAMDFVSDWVVGPQKESVRVINVMDEGSRRALWTEAHKSISAKTLIEVLEKIAEIRGYPRYVRCDNGPEFISHKLRAWAEVNNVEIKFIQPGKPSQNGLIERLNKTLRVECLNLHWFSDLATLNAAIQEWWHTYNSLRPHKHLGRITPDMYENENQNFYFKVVAA